MIFLLFLGFGARVPGIDCIIGPSGLHGDSKENGISRATIDFKDNPPVLWPNFKFIYEIVTDNLHPGNPCYNRKKSSCGTQDDDCLKADENGLINRTFNPADGKYQAVSQKLIDAGNEIIAKAPNFTIERYNETIHSQSSPSVSPICVANYEDGCFVMGIGYLGYASLMGIGRCYLDVSKVIHEILHALGLRHEHQSKISGEYLRTCQDKNENCYPNDYNCYRDDNYLPYKNVHDFSSVMHYPAYGCSMDFTEKGERLLEEMNMTADDVGLLATLSDMDAEALEFLYQSGPTTWFPSPSPTISPGGFDCPEGMYKEPSKQTKCYYPNAFSIQSGNCNLKAEGGCVTSSGHPNGDYPMNKDCEINVLKSGSVDWIDFYLDYQGFLRFSLPDTTLTFWLSDSDSIEETNLNITEGSTIYFFAGNNWLPVQSIPGPNTWSICLVTTNASNENPPPVPTSSPSGVPTLSPTNDPEEKGLSTELIIGISVAGAFFLGILFWCFFKNQNKKNNEQVFAATTRKLIF